MYKTIFVENSLFICVCNILMFCEFVIAVFLSLRERICSLKNFEFVPKRICSLKNFLSGHVYINKLCTPFRT